MQVAIIGGPALGGIIYTAGGDCRLRHLHRAPTGRLCFDAHRQVRTQTYAAGYELGKRHGRDWVCVAAQNTVRRHSLDLFAVLLGGATALLPIFARDILHVGPEGLGVLRAAPAVGALAVSLALIRWPLRRKVGYKLLGSVGIFGIGMGGLWLVHQLFGCRLYRWPSRVPPTRSVSSPASPSCNWKPLMKCAGECPQSTPYSSAPQISSGNLNPAQLRH